MNGSENYEWNRWTDDYEDPQYVAKKAHRRSAVNGLCCCTVLTGGALDPSRCAAHGEREVPAVVVQRIDL